jgi:hypothetical protein
MSAGSISLESSIRTCKVDTAWANKIESDRFLNPENMVCPIWNGVDTQGRQVCPDSYFTKRAGCNSAEDRVIVENNLRPSYYEYITLSANGLEGSIYGTNSSNQMSQPTKQLSSINKITGNFGSQFGASIYPSCSYKNNYQQTMAQNSEQLRQQGAMNNGYKSNQRRNMGY